MVNYTYNDSETAPITSGVYSVTGTISSWTYAGSSSGTLIVVPPPTVTSVLPNHGAPEGGGKVTISGSNFVFGAGVTFGGIVAINVNVISPTQITCMTPAHDAGAVDVVVTNPDGQSGKNTDGFSYVAGGVPKIMAMVASQNPAKEGTPVQFTATVEQANTLPLLYTWDFADGTAAGMENPVSHTFAGQGSYTVTLYVTDEQYTASAALTVTIYAAASGGATGSASIGTTVTNPLNNIAIEVTGNEGGLVELYVTMCGVIPTYTVTTVAYCSTGKVATVTGANPVFQLTLPGIYVIVATVTDPTNGTVVGQECITLPVGGAELGNNSEASMPPSTTGISNSTIKGKFMFNMLKLDAVSFRGTIELPAGLDLTKERVCAISAGNVGDAEILDSRGKAKSKGAFDRLKKLQVKYPRLKKPSKTTGTGMKATIQFAVAAHRMDLLGFGTEGIAPELAPGETGSESARRSIQIAVMLGDTAYRSDVPVQFKLSQKQDVGQISGPLK